MLDNQFCDPASEGPVIIMHQLKSIYKQNKYSIQFNSPFKDSSSHPIHTYLSMIASNVFYSSS